MKYSAFISYNHRDRDWAVWLHRALENYRVPKRLQGRTTPFGELGPKLAPVFRDRDELATSSDLAASVKLALGEAATLIVLCSPNSAKSKWVDQEIKTFIALGKQDSIRLIIVDGEPHASDPDLECLPATFRRDDVPEPLAADVRKSADGKEGAKLKIIAGILGVSYDDLRQREAVRKQRRLATMAMAATIGFVVMAALAVSALMSRNEAMEQRVLADRRTMTAERTLAFVKDMFSTADPTKAQGATITAREILDSGVERLDSSELQAEPSVKAELGATLADVYGALGLYRQSAQLVRDSLAVPHNDRAVRARQLTILGEARFRLGDYGGAAAAFRKAASIADVTTPATRSRIFVGLGQSLTNLGEYDRARAPLSKALSIDLARPDRPYSDLARDLEALGLNRHDAGELDQAEPYIRRALAFRLHAEGQKSPSVSDNYNTLGQIAYGRGDWSEAERYFRGNLASDIAVLGPDHPDTATTKNNLARILLEQGRMRDAQILLEEAIKILLRERGAMHDEAIFPQVNLGIVKRHGGQLVEAEALFSSAVRAARQNQHRALGPTLADLAEIRCAQGRTAEALGLLKEAEQQVGEDYPGVEWRSAWIDSVRGECLFRSGTINEGRRLVLQSSKVLTDKWPVGTLFHKEAVRRSRLVERANA